MLMTTNKPSLSEDAIAALSNSGFGLTRKPNYEIPSLPRDITELDDPALMDLFVQLTQWNDHAAGLFAVAVIDEREAERALDSAEAAAMLSNWTGAKGTTVTFIKSTIAAMPEIQKLGKELDVKYAFRKLIEARMENVERDAALVSRELTRRTSDGGMRSRQRKFTT
jgi:hypothetical protein